MNARSLAARFVTLGLLLAGVGCGRLNFGLEAAPDPDQAVSDAGVEVRDQAVTSDLATDVGGGVLIPDVRILDAGPRVFTDLGRVSHDSGLGTVGPDATMNLSSEFDGGPSVVDAGMGEVLPPPPTTSSCTGFQFDADDCWDGVVPAGATWSQMRSGSFTAVLDADYYVVDLFSVPQAVIDSLHADGRRVICSVNAGARESWRPDAGEFAPDDYASASTSLRGVRRLNLSSVNVRRIMRERLDLAVEKECDGVEPADIDSGLSGGSAPSTSELLEYNRFWAAEAHLRRLSVGLTNSPALLSLLEPEFDWAATESCFVFDECEPYRVFLAAGKAVLHTEYATDYVWTGGFWSQVCEEPSLAAFSTVIRLGNLGGVELPSIACR